MYRTCTLLALRSHIDVSDAPALASMADGLRMHILATPDGERLVVNGEDLTAQLRTPDVERNVSEVSKAAGVRTAMVEQQRRMAEEGRVVMVGRDIGSKVLPHAAKVYLEARLDVRVHRRLAEAVGKATEAQVRENVLLRDRTDSQRTESPLTVAADAVVVTTDELDVDGVVEEIVRVLGG